MFSYWERESLWKSPDVMILGSGIVGLAAAVELKQKAPNLHVVILERGFLPFGASTRNAGFACFGSVSELLSDLENQSEEEVFSLVEKRWKGLQRLRSKLGDDRIGYEPFGGYEVFSPTEQSSYDRCVSVLPRFNRLLHTITNEKEVFSDADAELVQFGMTGFSHLIRNKAEGQLDTGRMMQAWMELAQSLGVQRLTGVRVENVEQDDQDVRLITDTGFHLVGKQLLIATNGFAKNLFPQLDVHPARAQVLVTDPIPGLKLKGSFHYDEGYYYFRNVEDRILFGGGRNLDFEGETTVVMDTTEQIQERLEKMLRENLCKYAPVKIDLRWSGIMGIGPTKKTIVKKTEGQIYCAVRMGGMGVAIGSLIGEEAADLVLKGRKVC